MATCRPEGSHLCSDPLTLRYSPEALAAQPVRTLERPFGYDRLTPPFARLEAALTFCGLTPEVAVSTHWMRAAGAVRSKALGCDRDACTNGYQTGCVSRELLV